MTQKQINKTPATADDFELELNPTPGQLVHVEGWSRGCVFSYKLTTERGTHVLVTPKTGTTYRTRERLLKVRKK